MSSRSLIILGLDPGSRHTGFGLIKASGPALSLVAQGRLSPDPAWPLEKRLEYLYQGLSEVARNHRPQAVAVEDIFYGRNVRSALTLGHARGVALLVAAQSRAPVFEYAPILVKNSVTGYGRASKEQVAQMVGELLKASERFTSDAADALAVAICHAGRHAFSAMALNGSRRTTSSWRKISPETLAALGYKE